MPLRAFVYVFPLLFSIVAAILDATKMAAYSQKTLACEVAYSPQRNRNVNKRMHCIVVDQESFNH
jgi:hypothetical protein